MNLLEKEMKRLNCTEAQFNYALSQPLVSLNKEFHLCYHLSICKEPVELLAVDDCSSDGSRALLEDLAAQELTLLKITPEDLRFVKRKPEHRDYLGALMGTGLRRDKMGDVIVDGEAVDSCRADLGAVQNRMESTIRNQSNIAENQSDARSRIRDTDFAEETAALTQNTIIQQASQTILTQANQRPQIALSLLGG